MFSSSSENNTQPNAAIGDKMGNMAKQKYSDDYELIATTDEKGCEKRKAVYRGDYFEISLDEASLLKFRRYCSVLLAAIVVLHLGGGFIDNQGMYQFYVSLPYVLGFLPVFNLGQGILNLPREIRRYRREEIGRSFDRIKTASNTLLIILSIGLLGEIIYLIFISDQGGVLAEFLYLTAEILAIATVYFLIRFQKPIMVTNVTDLQEKQG